MSIFKCSYCLLEKESTQLAGTPNKSLTQLLAQKKRWEEELAKITTLQASTHDQVKKLELGRIIDATTTELHTLYLQIQNNKESICKTCWMKFKVQENKTFECEICHESINGEMFEGHVKNYQDEGISVRKLVKFCRSCKDNKVILATIYCPKKGDGRDGDWDIDAPLYDCDCPIPEERQIN